MELNQYAITSIPIGIKDFKLMNGSCCVAYKHSNDFLYSFVHFGDNTIEEKILDYVEEICLDVGSEGHEVLYQGRAFSEIEGDSLVIDSEEDWTNFIETLGFTSDTDFLIRDEIDWTQELVVVASTQVDATCGLYTQIADSCTKDGVSIVQLAVDDFSGSCEQACEAEDQVLLIVAVPTGEVQVETQIVPTCKEEG